MGKFDLAMKCISKVALLLFFIPICGSVQADLPGPPPGAANTSQFIAPGEDVSDSSGAPLVQGPLTSVGDTTKPGVPNVVFYDFGTISIAQMQPIRHSFSLKNISAAQVYLDHIQPGCGCTTASSDLGRAGAYPPLEPDCRCID
jgi:hypothetical protein